MILGCLGKMHTVSKDGDKPHKKSVAHVSLKILGIRRTGRYGHIPSEVKENLLHSVLSTTITETRTMLSGSLDFGGNIWFIIF